MTENDISPVRVLEVSPIRLFKVAKKLPGFCRRTGDHRRFAKASVKTTWKYIYEFANKIRISRVVYPFGGSKNKCLSRENKHVVHQVFH